MFTHNYTKGVILDNFSLREADRSYTLYTEDFGMIQVVGRSIRRGKLCSAMSLFSIVEVGFIQGKSYNTLTDAFSVFTFPLSRSNLGKMSLFYRISETILSLVRGEEKQKDVFSLITETMNDTEQYSFSSEELSLMHIRFSFRLLDKMGYRPVTECCVTCREKLSDKTYFSAKEGGTVCKKCANSTEHCTYLGDVRALRSFLGQDTKESLRQDHRLFENILKQYLSFIPETYTTKL